MVTQKQIEKKLNELENILQKIDNSLESIGYPGTAIDTYNYYVVNFSHGFEEKEIMMDSMNIVFNIIDKIPKGVTIGTKDLSGFIYDYITGNLTDVVFQKNMKDLAKWELASETINKETYDEIIAFADVFPDIRKAIKEIGKLKTYDPFENIGLFDENGLIVQSKYDN